MATEVTEHLRLAGRLSALSTGVNADTARDLRRAAEILEDLDDSQLEYVRHRYETVRVVDVRLERPDIYQTGHETLLVTAHSGVCDVQFYVENGPNRPRVGQYFKVIVEDYGPGSESYKGEFSDVDGS